MIFCDRFRRRLNAKVAPSLSQLREGWLSGASLVQKAGAAALALAQGLWSAQGVLAGLTAVLAALVAGRAAAAACGAWRRGRKRREEDEDH